MTRTFDNEVSFHSWLLWPTVRRRLLLNLWRNFDGGSLASTSLNDLHFDFAIIHAVICQLFVKNLILFAVKPNRKEMEPISVYLLQCAKIDHFSQLPGDLFTDVIGHLRPEFKFPAQIDFGFSQIHISHHMLIQLTLIKRQVCFWIYN